jgi:hypothetical protein
LEDDSIEKVDSSDEESESDEEIKIPVEDGV